MALIFESDNFIIESNEKPLVSREEGGNIRIVAKDKSITNRSKLTPLQAIEFMKLSIVCGEALMTVMNQMGVPVIKINYQDMGNWTYKNGESPVLHYHIFGRVLNVPHQPFPESVFLPDRLSGFYENFIPLTKEDVTKIRQEILRLLSEQKYSDQKWALKNQDVA